MNLKTQRNVLAVAVLVLLVVLGVLAGTGALSGAAGGQGKGKGVGKDQKTGKNIVTNEEELAINPLNTGQSVVGQDVLIPGLNIHNSGGNDIVYLSSLASDIVAFGANEVQPDGSVVENVVNGCTIPGGAIADVGSGDYTWRTKKHEYMFTFAEGTTVSKFEIGVLDWGDFLIYQAKNAQTANGTHTIQMFAYNANGELVAEDSYTFDTEDASRGYLRKSPDFEGYPSYTPRYNTGLEQYGINMKIHGDACEAPIGSPGKLMLTVQGPAITRVEVKFADQNSIDPHIALWLGALQIEYPEGTGTQGYWRNHAEAWPVSELTIGGVTYNVADAIAIMDQAGKGDKTYDLFAQYVAAKLNTLAGNDDSCIRADLTAAEEWFNANAVGSNVEADSDAWSQISDAHDNLDEYNNGNLCAPHRG